MGYVILVLIALGIAACGVSVSKSTNIVRDVMFPPGDDSTITIATLRIPADQALQVNSLIFEDGDITITNPSSSFNTNNIRTINCYAHTNAHPNDGQWLSLYDRKMRPIDTKIITFTDAIGQDLAPQIKTLAADGDVVIEVTVNYAGSGPVQPSPGVLSITLSGNMSVV